MIEMSFETASGSARSDTPCSSRLSPATAVRVGRVGRVGRGEMIGEQVDNS